MAHKHNPRNKPSRDKPSGHPSANVEKRNPYLDSLRAISILVMVADHAAGILWRIPLDYGTVRFATRISMPIFVILMGYLLATRKTQVAPDAEPAKRHKRLLQILMAATAVNLLYFPIFGTFDILVTLAICQLVYWAAKEKFVFAWFAVFFFPVDPTIGILDYPLSLILSLTAQGMIICQRGLKIGVVSGGLLTMAIWLFADKPSLLIFPFVLPATLLVGMAAKSIGLSFPALAKLGQYPLTIYVVQYYLLFAVAALMGAI
jgi:hypothetical protein